MYNNPYGRGYNNINQQNMYDQIDNQINQLQQMREQMKNNANQQPAINQTFQLAPTNREIIRYADSMEEVKRDNVIGDTPYFSRDMSVVWIKNTKGEIKTYELTELIEKDEKDIKIDFLMAQIEELKKGMNKDESTTDVSKSDNTTSEDEESSSISTSTKSHKKSK